MLHNLFKSLAGDQALIGVHTYFIWFINKGYAFCKIAPIEANNNFCDFLTRLHVRICSEIRTSNCKFNFVSVAVYVLRTANYL